MAAEVVNIETGVACELHDGVLWVALNRPRASNAVNAAVARAFADALDGAARDPAVGAVVMTATGDRVFSAGIDIKNPDSLDPAALSARRRDTVDMCLTAMIGFEKPLIAAVNGPAIGLGWMMVMLADRVIASERAVFSLPEIDIGIPTFLGISILSRAAGAALAREMVLTGRRMDAAEAYRRGLVSVLASMGELPGATQAAAQELATKPKAAYALNKRWLARGLREEFAAAHAQSAAVQPLLAADKPV